MMNHWEKLEDLSARFGLPHIPEYELAYFKKLYHPELRKELAGLASASTAERLARRGRLRRIFGDINGAAADLNKALDLDPSLAEAHVWLGEIDLRRLEAEESLTRGLSFKPARLYRGAARLLKGDLAGAEEDLRRCDGTLGRILLGRVFERQGKRAHAERRYAAAAALNPVCSAAHLLRSRAAATRRQETLSFRDAYNASPVLGFITLQIDRAFAVESPRYLRRVRGFAFEHPERVGAYYKREATQSHFSHFPAEDYGFVERLVRENPHLSWAHGFFGRAACYTPGGAPEGVRRLSRGIALAPHCGWLYAWRANALRILGKNREALEDFASAIRLQPFYHRAFVWRGSLLRKLGRLPEALEDLDRALAMDPFYSLTYHERSLVRRGLGDAVGSAFDLDRAFLLDHRYSWVFKTGGEPAAADVEIGLSELDAAVARHPHVPSLWTWRGHLKLKKRAFAEAFEDFERAVQMDPHNAVAFGWYGYGLLEAGQAERAAEKLETAVRLEPRFWYAYGWLAEAQWRRGRRAAALARLDGVLKEKPKTPWAHYLRAKFSFGEGKARAALKELRLALLLDGKYPEAYLLLAEVKAALKDSRGALEAANKCLEIAPNMGRAYVVRAMVHQQAGRSSEVVKDYRTALRDFPYLFNAEQKERMGAMLA